MGRKEEIELEIEKLRMELDNVHGGPTEVMQRITGYYRNVNYWNNGKREEFKDRKGYTLPPREKTEKVIQLHQG